ncbi:hypothetical protein [Aquimarina longa]|uniref:hypothetical protein n=1 Tax=Aquimarina longa TaxID=1080221 RepID=UPI000780517C|nr:hypothetical protein [Aquimarina longa]
MKKDNLHKNNSGFKVPQNYFENFENELSKKISSDSKTDVILSSKIESGFRTPKNYFTTLEYTITQKIDDDQPKRKSRALITTKNIVYITGIAAMIAITILLSVTKKSKLNFNDIEVADIHVYIDDENIKFSTAEIASILGNDINKIFEDNLITDEIILDYLSEENLNDEIIYIE